MAESLFDKLNLNEREVRALLQIPENRIGLALRQLKNFYGSVYLDSGIDDEVLHVVNNDLDILIKNPDMLKSEGRKYLDNESRQPASVTDRLRQYQTRAKEAGERVREVEDQLRESEDRVEPLEALLQETYTSLGIFRHLVLGNPSKAEGRVYIPELQNFTYLVETKEGVKILYRVDEGFHLRKDRSSYNGGKFAGGIHRNDIPPEMFSKDSDSKLREFGMSIVTQDNPNEVELYHRFGRKLKPFIEKGMYIITGGYLTPDKSDTLTVYAKVLEIKPI